ncbi:right-handed parallel beta-helix repeat-containing protein [Guptibacillus spartinae]|uniref:right-handed parallel beta-helix repeat-containing protein n=1 Tax=Guptibacillus spartinae TaxID=3025679 RepID=UPI0023610A05|nr:right-handed parallel beta-helix repeat-containing protein [Pseudalkalibacillus spartinae]
MAQKIQIKSCLKAELPLLHVGEFGLCTDTNELFIGSETGNLLLANNNDIDRLSQLTTANINDIDTTSVSPTEGNILEYQDGKWRPSINTSIPSSNNQSSYVLELERWNVKNDGTDAVNTTIGINNALVWAAQQHYKEVVLPTGLYLIDENSSIRPRSYMTLDLNGSTLKVRNNGLIKYAIIKFDENQQYSRVTNGRIEGDKDNHDYTTIPSTHEFGYGISVGYDTPLEGSNIRFITLDNLEVFNCTGDAITIASVNGTLKTIKGDEFESGGISLIDGTVNNQSNRIRYKLNISMQQASIKKYGYFGLYGGSYGGLGNDIKTDIYDVVFYRKNNTFLSSKVENQFFDEVEVPIGAEYAKVILHQKELPSSSGSTISIRVPHIPKNIFIEKCNLHDCRRLGISLTGGKHVLIKDCTIHHISGTAPQSGIDIEDARDINQYIFIDNNHFHDNSAHDIIAVSGRHLNITNNKLSKSLIIQNGANRSIINGNFFIKSEINLKGDAIFSNNHIYNGSIGVSGAKSILVSDCLFYNSNLGFSNTNPYSSAVRNCRIIVDNDYSTRENTPSVLSINGAPQSISNCSFEGVGSEPLIFVPNAAQTGWIFDNTLFKDTNHPQNIILRLPGGSYKNCRFINTGRIGLGTGSISENYEFNNCEFQWQNNVLFYLTPNLPINLNILNSDFRGSSDGAFSIRGNWKLIKLSNNIFEFKNSKSNNYLIYSYNVLAETVILENNVFKSTLTMKLGLDGINSNIAVYRDNFLQNIQPIFNENAISLNNIINGILD